ncbi:hypothetical protein J7E87_22095 [Streptomyces sp. ISL-1]|uniref:hypothetical protein n=1 Tax=Streptomyces sp. ISL-1 TaxID=2817657 RepID=UPI001BECACB1|nr:hypothetical protein [Streptomyces sp. ISL-1]MBT2392049.1 hypothetical protein [Streptomyces sp. ISL-1]
MHRQALAIYLNDHLAGATSGVELSRRIARAHRSSARAGEMQRLAEDIAQDRQALLEVMDSLEIPPRRYKIYAGWTAEKVARLKPNGRVVRRSGLSSLIELETLRLGIQGKHQLWQALTQVARESNRLDTSRLQDLMDRATNQMATVDSLHDAAARAVLSGGNG